MPGPYRSIDLFAAVSNECGRKGERPTLLVVNPVHYAAAFAVRPFEDPASGRRYLFGVEVAFVDGLDGAAAFMPTNEDERAHILKTAVLTRSCEALATTQAKATHITAL